MSHDLVGTTGRFGTVALAKNRIEDLLDYLPVQGDYCLKPADCDEEMLAVI